MTGKGSTLKDVAKAADVSIASASRAINGLDNVTEDVRTRVLEAATRLRYVPHWGARSLAMNRTNTIGLLLPDIYGEFFSEIIRGVDVAARAKGLHLLVSGSHGDLNQAVAALRAMGGRVDGLLVMSPFMDSHELATVLPLNLPLVTIASRLSTDDHGAISVDNFAGGELAVKHLFDAGCQRIAHICGPAHNFEAGERRRGYLSAMARLCPGQMPVIEAGEFTEDTGYAAMRVLLSQPERPDGVFAANDTMAMGALLALKEAGLSAPGDVSLIGFDDVPMARFTSPPLTTLKVGVYDMGRQGLEMLATAIEGAGGAANDKAAKDGAKSIVKNMQRRSIVITPELVVRESSVRKG